MTAKKMIFTLIAIGALSTAANAQTGTMSKPGMKTTTSTAAMPPKSDAMMDKKSDAMEDKKMSKSHGQRRHHHHGMRHHHHRMHKM